MTNNSLAATQRPNISLIDRRLSVARRVPYRVRFTSKKTCLARKQGASSPLDTGKPYQRLVDRRHSDRYRKHRCVRRPVRRPVGRARRGTTTMGIVGSVDSVYKDAEGRTVRCREPEARRTARLRAAFACCRTLDALCGAQTHRCRPAPGAHAWRGTSVQDSGRRGTMGDCRSEKQDRAAARAARGIG